MSSIVAARFETFEHAEVAALSLRQKGFYGDRINSFFVNPAGQHASYRISTDAFADVGTHGVMLAAIIGAVLGAVVGALLFALFAIPALLVIALALVGAYAGSLAWAVGKTGSAPSARAERAAGVLLAVLVDGADHNLAIGALRAAGGRDVEQAEGEWREGKWADFDPVKPPWVMY